MSFNKNVDSYPEAFFELVEKIDRLQQPVQVAFESRNAALHLRFKFYDFKKALRLASGDRASELRRMAERVSVTVQGNVLTFNPRDGAAGVMALSNALRNMGNISGVNSDDVEAEIMRLRGQSGIDTNTHPCDATQIPRDQESLLSKFYPNKD